MNRWELMYVAGVFTALFIPISIVFIASGKHWRKEQDKARERRFAEAKMYARLLKLNI